ncbi:unnamed protein product [Calypogeia fissa]
MGGGCLEAEPMCLSFRGVFGEKYDSFGENAKGRWKVVVFAPPLRVLVFAIVGTSDGSTLNLVVAAHKFALSKLNLFTSGSDQFLWDPRHFFGGAAIVPRLWGSPGLVAHCRRLGLWHIGRRIAREDFVTASGDWFFIEVNFREGQFAASVLGCLISLVLGEAARAPPLVSFSGGRF